MNIGRGFVRITALTVVLAMPLLGMSGIASAKGTKAAAPKCVKHPKSAKCQNSGGGSPSGGGTGGPPAQITVKVSPNPLVETGQSEIHAVIEVETLPSFAGDTVLIDSSQLIASCNGGVTFENMQGGVTTPGQFHIVNNRIEAVLDNDGNATVVVDALDCAPGTSVVEADLEVAPFLTALTTLVALPPSVTPEGLTGYPQRAGVAQEVETGDTSTSGDSNVYAVFYVETRSTRSRPWRSTLPSSTGVASAAGVGSRVTVTASGLDLESTGRSGELVPTRSKRHRPFLMTTATLCSSSRASRVPPGLLR